MHRTLLLLACTLTVLVSLAVASTAGAWAPTLTGTILFASENGTLFTMNADMTNVQVVGAGFRPQSFALSPDGTRIACAGGCAGGIAILKPDGTDLAQIPGTDASDSEPNWSPNGTK